MTEPDTMGPVSYLVVEFPSSKMTGEGMTSLVDLVDRGAIRILDLVFVKRAEDGTVTRIELADLDADGQLDLSVFQGASSGLLDPGDLADAGSVLEWGPRREFSSSRTAGRRPSSQRSDEVGESWWPPVMYPRTPWSLRSTPPIADLNGREGEFHARTAQRSRKDCCDRRNSHGRVEPGLQAPGQSLVPAGATTAVRPTAPTARTPGGSTSRHRVAVEGPRRAQEPRNSHGGRVRGAEGQDSGHVTAVRWRGFARRPCLERR